MKKIYLTFDIETIVSGLGYNSNYLCGVYLGAMYIANQLKIRNLKGTFFVSLSSKMDDITNEEYIALIGWLIRSLKGFDNIKIEPHMHAYRLKTSFDCYEDSWNEYTYDQQVSLLELSKELFNKNKIEANTFRPGGFVANEDYYRALNKAGFLYSSILHRERKPQIDLITGNISELTPYEASNSIKEYPVSSVKVKSIKGVVEILNLSPDFFTLNSVKHFIDALDYLNINFHSFSVFLNRPIRENFSHIYLRNLRFICFDYWICKFFSLLGYDLYKKETIHRKELIKWLDYIKESTYKTYFIGE